jgi:hypothetical protein
VRRTFIVAVLALLSCGPRITPTVDASVPVDASCNAAVGAVRLGSGNAPSTAGYVPLEDGDAVYLTPGPQGGQHVWIGLRGEGFDPTQPLVQLRAWRVSDGVLIGQIRIRLRFSPAPDAPQSLALAAQTLVVDDDQYCSVIGQSLRVTLDLNDGAGHCLHAERTVRVAGLDPNALEIDRTARMACCTQYLRRCYPAGPPADAAVPADASLDGGPG